MPSDLFLKTGNTIHRTLLRVSRGRIGWRIGGMPTVVLTTTGRKSGDPRTVMLSSPLPIGDSIVLVASKGGADTHPAWFLNLRDNPEVRVSTNGAEDVGMYARIVGTEERSTLWERVAKAQPRYAAYQGKTAREIPIVVLERSR